jgi:hypothetical protein
MNCFRDLLIGRHNYSVKALGFIDTGNMLKDISTGKYVVVASPAVMYELLPLSLHHILYDYTNGIMPFDRKTAISLPSGTHLVPYRTVNAETELMLAFDCDFLFINNKLVRQKPLIGISRSSISINHTNKCILLNSIYMRKVKKYDKYNN